MSELPADVRAKVLIVEDDVIVALDLQGMVTRLGYDVVAIVDTGQTAISAAQRFRPDIILLDLILIGPLDGIDAAREIHKTLDIPIIFCTSSTDISVLIRAKEITYSGYLLKPINPDSLSTTLDTALYEYKLEKRVELAEIKFRALVEKCNVMQFFFDQNAAFEWIWKKETGTVFSAQNNPEKLNVNNLAEKIDGIISRHIESLTSGDSMSTLLELKTAEEKKQAFTLLGIWNEEKAQIGGMIIPLAEETP